MRGKPSLTVLLFSSTWLVAGCDTVSDTFHTAHNVARSTVHGTAQAVRTVAHGTATVAHGTATVVHKTADAVETVTH